MSKLSPETLNDAVKAIIQGSLDSKRKFTETVELQIGLKNYDPQKDKRFSGTIRVPHQTKAKLKVCVLGDQQHCDEAAKLGVPFLGLRTSSCSTATTRRSRSWPRSTTRSLRRRRSSVRSRVCSAPA